MLTPNAARVRRALERAREDARRPPPDASRAAPAGRIHAMGDPQAPLATVLAVLDSAGLLGEAGRLRPDVHLVSIGDHFDWGTPDERPVAARDGLALLSWLAAHPPERVTLLLGNHDLARVGELAHFDAAGYERARDEADRVYRAEPPDPGAEERFRARHPELPTAECLSRDLSGFDVAQRDRVARLLRARRFRAALACGPRLLLTHAGLTRDDVVGALGLAPGATAPQIAERFDARLDDAVTAWDGRSALAIPGVHQPGNGVRGEARGLFAHRPAHPDRDEARLFEGPLRRRFDPRRLPPGLTQVVGHSADARCRESLGPWVEGPAAPPGGFRGLVTDGETVRYAAGLPSAEPGAARLVFIDGGMARCPPDRYRLLETGRLG